MQEHSPDIASRFPEHSFLLGSAATSLVKWCLYLRHVSSRAYEVLRNSGVVTLLYQRTLRDYTHFVESVPGFSADLDETLMEVSKGL